MCQFPMPSHARLPNLPTPSAMLLHSTTSSTGTVPRWGGGWGHLQPAFPMVCCPPAITGQFHLPAHSFLPGAVGTPPALPARPTTRPHPATQPEPGLDLLGLGPFHWATWTALQFLPLAAFLGTPSWNLPAPKLPQLFPVLS